ncbi:MAG: DNA integrity scanning protein DisA [Firmicutes bacterium]|jgi:diadenylate cyclase|nr:DNA integrity scanning protein DisA [Bacillota bacterium]HQD39919.1 DNA integrity scanning diadenylate cyclase DisA [Bacillota bacterium]
MRDKDDFQKYLKMVAPGTLLNEGLENILRARTGALIVVGDSDEVMELVDGGFRIDSDFNPAALYELAKMDGAIILSSDAKRILFANTQLNPDPMIPSSETGTRHRTAERVAKQTGQLVISISQRRNIITMYRSNIKYVLRDVGVVLAKANQALQTLERYKNVLERALTNLTAMEFEDLATLYDVATAIQRAEMTHRIELEIQRYITELGTEGRLAAMQLEELMVDVKNQGYLIIKDYLKSSDKTAEEVAEQLHSWSSDEILDLTLIGRALGYGSNISALDSPVYPRGYRILTKIPRLPMPVIENLIETFNSFQNILRATTDELDDVEGIGEVRARAIKEGLHRLREQVMLDRHL